jgi:hypothetical protein
MSDITDVSHRPHNWKYIAVVSPDNRNIPLGSREETLSSDVLDVRRSRHGYETYIHRIVAVEPPTFPS